MENNNKGLSQDQIARLQKLAGIKTNLTESEDSKGVPTSTLDKTTIRVGVDGVKYGIVKENANYFIKKSTSTVENLTESDFIYLGGLANKNKYKYPSHGDALKNLNMMMITLNESFNITETKKEDTEKKEEVKEVEGSTTAKDFKVDDPEKVAFKEEEEVTDTTTDVVVDAPAAEVSADVATTEPTAEVPATDTTADAELDAEDPVKEVQSMVGKLTNKIRNTELTEDATKSVLNSVIAALNLKLISDEDRLAIAKKVKKGGEDTEVEANAEVTNDVAPVAEPTADEVVAENVKRLKALIENKLNPSTAHPAKVAGGNTEQKKSQERGEVKGFAKPFEVLGAKEKEANTKKFEPKTNSNKYQDKNFKAKDSGKLEPKAKQVNEGYERLSNLIDRVIRERK